MLGNAPLSYYADSESSVVLGGVVLVFWFVCGGVGVVWVTASFKVLVWFGDNSQHWFRFPLLRSIKPQGSEPSPQ